MEEKAIIAKRGTFGRVQVTLLMTVKEAMLAWQKVSGMGKAEFLRVALMIGAARMKGMQKGGYRSTGKHFERGLK